jgi:hypothetical protein
MNLRYRVELSQAERDELKALLSGGRHAVRKVKRAQILLAADAGASDEESRGCGAMIIAPSVQYSARSMAGAASRSSIWKASYGTVRTHYDRLLNHRG